MLLSAGSEENKLPAGADPSPAGEASPSLTLPASATPEKRKAGRKAGKQVMACKCTTTANLLTKHTCKLTEH